MIDFSSQPMSVVLQTMAREYVKSDEVAGVIAEQAVRVLSDNPSLLDGSLNEAIRAVIHRLALEHLSSAERQDGTGTIGENES